MAVSSWFYFVLVSTAVHRSPRGAAIRGKHQRAVHDGALDVDCDLMPLELFNLALPTVH